MNIVVGMIMLKYIFQVTFLLFVHYNVKQVRVSKSSWLSIFWWSIDKSNNKNTNIAWGAAKQFSWCACQKYWIDENNAFSFIEYSQQYTQRRHSFVNNFCTIIPSYFYNNKYIYLCILKLNALGQMIGKYVVVWYFLNSN